MLKVLLSTLCLLALSLPAMAQGTISGIVTVEGGDTPIGMAHVAAFSADSNHPVADAQSGPDGGYVLDVPFGEYLVLAAAERFYPEWYNNVPHREDATAVTVTEDHNPDGIDFSLAPFQQEGGEISGRIIEEGTDHGIPMAHVVARRIEGEPFERSTLSGWEGGYHIAHLPPGPYVVSAEKWGWNGGSYPETLMVVNNSFENIDIYLTPGGEDLGSISGVITDAASGEPIAGAHVVARSGNHFERAVDSDDFGNYTIEGLFPGVYHVSAHKQGYVPGEYPEPVPVEGNDVTGIDIALHVFVPTGIMGMVTDAGSGEPIAGARVDAVSIDDHRTHRFAMTGEDGAYVLEVPPGEYHVEAHAWGYVPQTYPENVIVPEDGFVDGINFALAVINFGSISGNVSDAEGNPVAGAVVRARTQDGFFRRHAVTDESGAYTLAEILPGTYIIHAFKFGYAPGSYPDPVVVGDGEDVTDIDIVLEADVPPFDGYISGTVTDEDTGEPIAEAMVLGIGFGGNDRHHWHFRRAFTGDDGTYTLEYLPDVEFRVFAVHHEYYGEFYDNVRRFWEATPVTPDADGINFAMEPRSDGLRSISGMISLQNQELPGEGFVYASVDGEIVDLTVTDIDGFYSFNDLDIGQYEISAFTVMGEGELGYIADVTDGDLEGADILLDPTSVDDGEILPIESALSQNYPNPFNAGTMIAFDVSQTADIELAVYNVIGQKVVTLVNGLYQPGSYQAVWDGFDSNRQPAASGIYYYKLAIGDRTEAKRMTLLK